MPMTDMFDPSVATDPSKWLTPAGQLNPLNPIGMYSRGDVDNPDVPKVESPADLKARHDKIDGAYAKAQKDYMDNSNAAHAMVASGTNYSHDALHDLSAKVGAAQSTMQHLRAMKAQLPPLPVKPTPQVSPAFKARMAGTGAITNQTTSEALDALAKQKAEK